ncbi:MAG: TonB-dependent outer rane receptor FecA5 [Sphingomonas bacterium]|nr:TonB-dependent outer rane receptor FecA5 [Sphingomonas bacterium]
MSNATTTRRLLSGASALILATLSSAVQAETKAATPAVDTAPAADDPQKIAEGSDVVVTATRANEIAPVTASLQTTQPQSIISRSFIEDSLPATSDFNQIALISPSVSGYGNANGPGLSESKAQIRGFQDGEYNITYDGVPFGDTNDPTHHSNTFFPSNTIETLIVDRGPGNASQLGQATFGGNINLFSRATRDDMGVELKASYGSYNTYLLRGVFQSGAIHQLGGTEIVLSGQHIKSDGARSFSPFSSNNIFGKIMIPIGASAKLTILGTYNENDFNQPDKDGVTLSQVALYGKQFSLNNDPNSQDYFRYNHTHKTTDFEVVKFEATIAPNSTFENRAYTYSYDNETLSGNDVTLFATDTAANIAKANTVILTPGGASSFGVPGYTKTNKYRMFGDIAKTRIDFGFGAITAGAWIEWSNTYRQQRDVDLVTMAPNFAEKALTTAQLLAAPPGTPQPPANIKFDQNSHTQHAEEFVELELRPIAGLKIAPGFKHVDFTRQVDALYNQTVRFAQRTTDTYSADLPFATINYTVNDRLAVYAQYARGFLAPSLGALYVANPGFSTIEPERSTNYQAGVVYHGGNLSVDADVYKIDFSNKFASFTSPTPGVGTVFINQGSVQYKGFEGQITYALPHGLAVFANGSRNYAKTRNPGQLTLQVANAPEWTAAAGILYKHGPIRLSLIDKYVGAQWFTDPTAVDPTVAIGTSSLAYYNSYRSSGYNTAIASVRYDIGPVRVGVEVNNLFNSQRVTNVSTGKTTPFDQYVFQTGRSYTADVTLTF